MEEVEIEPGRLAYRIASGPGHCIASWRTGLLLPQGRYTFSAVVTTQDVVAVQDDKGAGAGLRISGANRENRLDGTQANKELQFQFTIEEEFRQVDFVAELRAEKGEVLFAAESFQLQREPTQ